MFRLKSASLEAAPPTFEVHEILEGLTGSLIEVLANLVGSTEDDLLVTFQVMPWGDRATLAAYGVLTLDRTGHIGRVASVSPLAVELVNAAGELVASRRKSESASGLPAGQDEGLLAAAALPLVEILETEPADSVHLVTVPGVVEKVDHSFPIERVLVRVMLVTPGGAQFEQGESTGVQVATMNASRLKPGSVVGLTYDAEDASLSHPNALFLAT